MINFGDDIPLRFLLVLLDEVSWHIKFGNDVVIVAAIKSFVPVANTWGELEFSLEMVTNP